MIPYDIEEFPASRDMLLLKQKSFKKAWKHCWDNELSMRRIRSWIEEMPQHIQEVICLKGGNEYREGKDGGSSSVQPYDSKARRERYQRQQAGIRPGDETDTDDANTEEEEEEEEKEEEEITLTSDFYIWSAPWITHNLDDNNSDPDISNIVDSEID